MSEKCPDCGADLRFSPCCGRSAALREKLTAAEAEVERSRDNAKYAEEKEVAERARAEAAEADGRVMADQELRRSRMGEFDVRRQRQEANALYRELVEHKAEVEAAVERHRSKP